ncbi:hydroxyneurosporene dehydrogenase [Microbacterium sp. LWS13-1.2]|uniref:Hydroxyneurosporene dehydrogenase n=1 Tax=Microbacterium sp. LWS13-1.2 TaxID=3135264 RepID=A0AAU6SBR0_9MICO
MTENTLARLARSDAEYTAFGLSRTIQRWEDGARTDNRAGTYEWWYFDAHLADGSVLVIVFQNKDFTVPRTALDPLIRFELTLPDGRQVDRIVRFNPAEWSAATDHADVRIGAGNRFSGDLHEYRISVDLGDVSADVVITGEVPAWRPETGIMLFGERQDHEFGWLPSVPQGQVTASYTVDGKTTETTGVGYHDHNWGNAALPSLIHNWYWARGQAGPFSVIASYITAAEDYDFNTIPLFLLAKDGEVVADDDTKVTFDTEVVATDERTGKPVADVTRYTYVDGDDTYVVKFERRQTIASERLIDTLSGPKKLAAKIARFDGAYLRFSGAVTVEHYRRGDLVDTANDDGVWELMYFGHAR